MPASILCVDRDRNACLVLGKALSAEGYRVLAAHDGEEALQMIEEAEPDLLLLDLETPGRDGFELLSALRALEGDVAATPTVLISAGRPSPEARRRAGRLAAVALIQKPISLERLRQVVAEALHDGKRGVPVDPRPASPRAAAGLAGSLERLPFAALLHHLHGLRADGVLHLVAERKRKWIQFRDGYPVAVRSNLVNECLGNLLVREGRVTPKQAAKSRRLMRDGRLQGEILVAMQVMSESEIATALRVQAEEKLFEIFEWERGSFRFDVAGRLQRANELSVETSPANLILTGARTRLPLRHVDAWLSADRGAYVRSAESPFYRFQEVDLDEGEQQVLRGLDGGCRLSELLSTDERMRRTVYGLLAAGLIELRSRPPERAEASPPRPVARHEAAAPGPAVAPSGEVEEALRAELADRAERMRSQSHFEVMGLPEDADTAAIQRAYEALAQRVHPDRASGCSQNVRELAEEVFARIAEAHETLSDPQRRQIHLLDRRREAHDERERVRGQRALHAELEFQHGERALRQRSYELAMVHFGKALELCPEEGEYHAHYAWALFQCHPGDPAMVSEALEHAKRGVKLASHRDKPYLFLGRLCKAVGRVDAAERMFARAVAIRPDCAEAHSELRLIDMRRTKSKGIIRRLLRR